MELSIMTFNLRVDVLQDGDNAWPHRKTYAAQIIEQSGAAIVCTQEGLHRMVLDLEQQLPQFAWLGQGRHGGTGDEYNAIFYNRDLLRLVDSGHFWLSETPDKPGSVSWQTACPRMCTWGRFQAADSPETSWFVFNTHLDHISEEARIKGIRLIWQNIQDIALPTGLPVFLTGDFNATPNQEPIRYMRGLEGIADAYSAYPGGDQAAGQTAHSFEGGEEGEPIDYIFALRAKLTATTVDRSTVDGKYPSDHYPVITRAELG